MKKLLLILLSFPVIGYGQDIKLDEIIFSNGDTTYGNVIEVGVNEITYRYKGEATNNISKNRDIAKIKYASGRMEAFDELQILEREKKKIRKNLNVEKKKEKIIKEDFSNSFEIGLVLGPTVNTYTKALYPYEESIVYNVGLTFKHNFSPYFSLKYNLQYQKKGAKWNNDIFREHLGYLSLPCVAQFSFGNDIKFYANSGLYLSYLIDGHKHLDWSKLIFSDIIDPIDGIIKSTEQYIKSDLDLSRFNRLDFGPVFGIGCLYELNQQIIITFELSSHLGLVPIYSLNNANEVNCSYLMLIGASYKLNQ